VNKVNLSRNLSRIKFSDVAKDRDSGSETFGQELLAIGVVLNEPHCLESSAPFKAEIVGSGTGEQAESPELSLNRNPLQRLASDRPFQDQQYHFKEYPTHNTP
jgi:hypothetical protein